MTAPALQLGLLPQTWPTIVSDNPWAYDDSGARGGVDHHYKTLSTPRLVALPVHELAWPNAHLWLWVTAYARSDGLKMRTLERRREVNRQSTKRQRTRAISEGRCGECFVGQPSAGRVTCDRCLNKHRDDYNANKASRIDVIRRRRMALRLEVYQRYGGAFCACCKEANLVFLTIDHVDGEGAAHRKVVGSGGDALSRWLRRAGFPPGFQVLCFNCNLGKYQNKGVCPHANERALANLEKAVAA